MTFLIIINIILIAILAMIYYGIYQSSAKNAGAKLICIFGFLLYSFICVGYSIAINHTDKSKTTPKVTEKTYRIYTDPNKSFALFLTEYTTNSGTTNVVVMEK